MHFRNAIVSLAACAIGLVLSASTCVLGGGDEDSRDTGVTDPSDAGGGTPNGESEENTGEGESYEVRAGWQIQQNPFDDQGIYGIEFVDESTAYAATTGDAGAGAFWRSRDGGDSWTPLKQQVEAKELTKSLDGDRLWGFQTPGGSEFGPWFSDDDGESWMPREFGTSETIEQAVFFSDAEGLAASTTARRIKRTSDGGESWTNLSTEDALSGDGGYVECSISEMQAIGDVVWVGGSTDAEDDAQKGGCVAWSTERGESGTWTLHKFTNQAHSFQGSVIEGIWMKSKDEVWAVGQDRQMYWTKDGGETWNQVEGIPASMSSFSDISGHGEFLVATARSQGGTGEEFGQGGLTYHSHDGGESWEVGWSREEQAPNFDGVVMVGRETGYIWSEEGLYMSYVGRE